MAELQANLGSVFTRMIFDSIAPSIDGVVFRPPRTIVNWTDGTKTIVKTHQEEFDEEKGLAMAISRKLLGSRSQFEKLIDSASRQSYERGAIERQKITKEISRIVSAAERFKARQKENLIARYLADHPAGLSVDDIVLVEKHKKNEIVFYCRMKEPTD